MTMQYRVTEKKKAEIDSLTTKVQDTEYLVAQLQSVVSSLSEKSSEFTTFLADAEAGKETALNNFNLVKSVVNTIRNLTRATNRVNTQTSSADRKIKKTAKKMSQLISQLIFSAEIVDKLAQLIDKKKASNPLISDELVKVITTATADANNAVATTLTALQSCYATSSSAQESTQITSLEFSQSISLYSLITGDNKSKDNINDLKKAEKDITAAEVKVDLARKMITRAGTDTEKLAAAEIVLEKAEAELKDALIQLEEAKQSIDRDINQFSGNTQPGSKSLLALLTEAYKKAKQKYDTSLKANNGVTKELEEANAKLASATIRLNSLKAGLAAATAAAMAA